ncbi:regulator of chromosome condensation 1/beta-lactamase-inhibitor protein II [Crucibulum laeve]|uniref:Regulator of chromosome condensation 1/beta-lactamase-inhibitor protein II n=1 Tax=Crucibulum laeve TaxID=68775 RepID=A0A5C3MCM3_9AGAR|nr:regulator of chromosome condensation 1/beta-lactamase-inhibitor protein II [Crucibulum laeve]
MLSLYSSGSNAHGQLANGSLDDSYDFQPCSFSGCALGSLPANTRNLLNVANGANHSLVLLEVEPESGLPKSELWGCGDGRAGQLGPAGGSTVFTKLELPLERTKLQGYSYKLVCASWETTYVVLQRENAADVLISMGADDFGDLGIGGRKKGKGKEVDTPFHIVSFEHLTVDGLTIAKDSMIIETINSGQHHVVIRLRAIFDDGSTRTILAGWGTARHGQLGDVIPKEKKAIPFHTRLKLVLVDDPDDPIISAALGIQHTVFLHKSGRLAVLGSNRKGQLQGMGSIRGAIKIDCTWNGTYAVQKTETGAVQLLAAGSNSHRQLGNGIPPDSEAHTYTITKFPELLFSNRQLACLACGSEHVLLLLSANQSAGDPRDEVWGWGWNEHGNLGVGDTNDVSTPAKLWTSKAVTGIWGGNGTSWICSRTI